VDSTGGGCVVVGGENSGGNCPDSRSPLVDGGGAPMSAPASEDSIGGGGPAGHRVSLETGGGRCNITGGVYGDRSLCPLLFGDSSDGEPDGQPEEFVLDGVLLGASGGETAGGWGNLGVGSVGDGSSAHSSMVTPAVAKSGGEGSGGSNAGHRKYGARLSVAADPGQVPSLRRKHDEDIGNVDQMREVS